MSLQDQIEFKNRLNTAKFISETKRIVSENQTIEKSNLNTIKGLGQSTITRLFELGVTTKEQLRDFDLKTIQSELSPLAVKNINIFLTER